LPLLMIVIPEFHRELPAALRPARKPPKKQKLTSDV
jgi:hypothetical protein